MKKKFSLAVTVFLIPVFLFAGIPAFPAYAQNADASVSIANLAIPENLGKVEERFQGTSEHWVIQIQSVHAHFTAQENIAAIVDHLNAVYGLKTAALEGGWGDTSFPEAWGVPSSREKQMLARALLEEEYITGPAYAALFSQEPLRLIGIENPEIYEANRQVYLEYLNQKSAIDSELAAVRKRLEEAKDIGLNGDLRSFDKAASEFREGNLVQKFIPALFEWADLRQTGIQDLAQLKLFKDIMAVEQAIDKNKLRAETDRLMAPFKKQRLSFEEVLRNKKVTSEQLLYYPETVKYTRLLELKDQMVYRDFFRQIYTAIERVEEKLIQTPAERELLDRTARFLLGKKIITLQATPDDLASAEKQKDALTEQFSNDGMKAALDLGFRFYDLALKRDQIFFDALTGDPRLGGNRVIVTGGFHTAGLSEKLRAEGISYITLTPDLGGEVPNEELYAKRLGETVKTQALDENQNRIFFAGFDTTFLEAVQAIQETRNIAAGIEVFRRFFSGIQTARVQAPVSANTVPMRDFLAWDTKTQLNHLAGWAKRLETGESPILVISTDDAVTKAFTDPLNQTSWVLFAGNKANTAIILGPDFPSEMLGGKSKIRYETSMADIETFLASHRSKAAIQEAQGRAGGIEGNAIREEGGLVVFPVEWNNKPLRGIFLITAALLRGDLQLDNSPEIQNQFWASVEGLLSQFNTVQELIAASA